MRRLLLIRHAESAWNAEHRIQGQSGSGLSSRGRAQAAALAASLADQLRGAPVVSSDLERARQTAEVVARSIGATVVEDPRLRERDFGDWEGRRRDEVERDDPDHWSRWIAGEDVIAEIGGESSAQLARRASGVFRALLEATSDDGVTIAVTHGGTIWRGLHELLGLPERTLGPVENTSIAALVSYRAGQVYLDRWNDVGHLPAELRAPVQRIGAVVGR